MATPLDFHQTSMASPNCLEADQTHATTDPINPVHRCLFVSEILRLIFEFIRLWDEDSRRGDADEETNDPDADVRRGSDGRRTLASLVRTCRSFNIVALDILWRVLNSLDPLLMICPKPEASMDETDWSSFRKYAERVRSIQIRGREARVPALVKQTFVASFERYPSDQPVIFPNLTELDWRETTFLSLDDSGVPLFKYFAGPTVTTITLSCIRSQVPPASELAILSDLPNLCPNVTSFTVFFSYAWNYDPSRQVGEMASQWKRLRSLRSCAISQSDMDKLASQGTLQTLGIEITTSSPIYVGRVPDTVQELLLSPWDTTLCTRYLQNIHGSPTICRLFIGMNHVDEAEIEALFQLLPLCLDTSRLQRLTIQPRSVFVRTRLSEIPKLRTTFLPPLVQFSSLRELDMDVFCTSQVNDAEYARMAQSLPYLRHLKVGTAKLSSVIRPYPVATVVAVIGVVTYCPHLETLCIPFDGRLLPPFSVTQSLFSSDTMHQERGGGHEPWGSESSAVTYLGDVVKGWGMPNKRITKLHVGNSPVADAAIGILASCFKSLLPGLKQIQHHGLDERWDAVQHILTS